MNASISITFVLFTLCIAGCATDSETLQPSAVYEDATAKTPSYNCPSGYVLSCESKKVGRIRFSRMGNANLDSCSCELYQGMPTQSPLPGIH